MSLSANGLTVSNFLLLFKELFFLQTWNSHSW